MDTGKQINAMVVVLLLTIIAVGFYALFDPFRADTAEEDQLDMTAERAAHTFALNCRLCHGDRGQGGMNGGRLPAAPALDVAKFQGIDNGVFSAPFFDEQFKFITNTISCGRAGTFMPTWGRENGGTLSDEQIRQLAVLITGADIGADPIHTGGFWEEAQHAADEIDWEATEHATLVMPDGMSAGDTEIVVSNAGPLSAGQYIRIDEERLRILPKMLEVQRGVNGTDAVEHTSGAEIFRDGEDTDKVIGADVDNSETLLMIDDTSAFTAGDTLQIDDEMVRVTEVITGTPTTNQRIIQDIGREPKEVFVSGADGIAVGDILRAGHELIEVTAIREDGSLDISLDAAVNASSDLISVDTPAFFGPGYTFHVGSEVMKVVGAVETGQLLAVATGRAQTTISVTGSEGIAAGDRIRMGEELLDVVEVTPATITVERGANDVDGNPTGAASHSSGADILKQVDPPAEGAQPEDPETGQVMLDTVDTEATTFTVSGTTGISLDSVIQVGSELMLVTATTPAELRVERGVGGTERGVHARRVPIFSGNFIEVERGALGTSAAAHDADAELLFDVLGIKREVGNSLLGDQAKNTELFIGNDVVVERGLLNSEAAEHADGAGVRNFPPAPDGPATTGATCGQNPPADVGGPTTNEPRDDAAKVDISLNEYTVGAEPPEVSAPNGLIDWDVANDGTNVHNFRVIATEDAPDALPVVDGEVDESAVDVVGGIDSGVRAGDSSYIYVDLDPGNYVLICNIVGHYELGMHVGFTVTQ